MILEMMLPTIQTPNLEKAAEKLSKSSRTLAKNTIATTVLNKDINVPSSKKIMKYLPMISCTRYKLPIVAQSNTIADVWAVMIKSLNTIITSPTMYSPWWPPYVASVTPLLFFWSSVHLCLSVTLHLPITITISSFFVGSGISPLGNTPGSEKARMKCILRECTQTTQKTTVNAMLDATSLALASRYCTLTNGVG